MSIPMAYLYQAPSGVKGDISRRQNAWVEQAFVDSESDACPKDFGVPVVLTAGNKLQIFNATDAGTPYGVLARVAPTMGTPVVDVDPNVAQGVMRKGYMIVECLTGTPIRNGEVFVDLDGNFVAEEIDGETSPYAGAAWAIDGKDANNLTEIVIL